MNFSSFCAQLDKIDWVGHNLCTCIFLFACIENLINIIWQCFVFCWLARSHVIQQGQSWVDDDKRADWEEMNLLWWPNHYCTNWGWSWWQHHWWKRTKKLGRSWWFESKINLLPVVQLLTGPCWSMGVLSSYHVFLLVCSFVASCAVWSVHDGSYHPTSCVLATIMVSD